MALCLQGILRDHATLSGESAPPDIVLTQPLSRKLFLHEPLSVTAAGTKPLSYDWWKDGAVLAQGNNSAFLTLTNLQGADAGSYWVVVSNVYGSVTSAVALLTVNLATLDSSFNPGASAGAICLAVQADGKILVGGGFTTLGGQTRNNIGRLNADGSLDSSFNPGAGGWVCSLAVQADGKILVGGGFTTLGGQSPIALAGSMPTAAWTAASTRGLTVMSIPLRCRPTARFWWGAVRTRWPGHEGRYIGRLNADGQLDGSFIQGPGAADVVSASVICLRCRRTGRFWWAAISPRWAGRRAIASAG